MCEKDEVRSLPTDPGGLAQLARAPALHAGGHRFESDILHQTISQLANELISQFSSLH
jgi:hypothetical protein